MLHTLWGLQEAVGGGAGGLAGDCQGRDEGLRPGQSAVGAAASMASAWRLRGTVWVHIGAGESPQEDVPMQTRLFAL